MSENVLMRRLDIAPKVVEAAKVAFKKKNPGREPYFREVLDFAATRHLKMVEESLERIGFGDHGKNQNRQRPVSTETWEQLEDIEYRYGVSRAQLVRGLLAMLADEADSRSKRTKEG